ncbi:protein phosphatase 1 regulatory subunit 12B [Lingula anatina]|uniref:Protein phosphatase 1 regulatory subunit 12B n=1 Tax=Lingula anatina TaxID=7574 RepID=A0A1S3H2F2_LINAN|nr:protein phosphatase 1 regulatory subunit 12B [Lingula anatina]|eukprot:XP_013380193.1 protein phosphatase 1 regulatory subunit 12B [Lingula anatina]
MSFPVRREKGRYTRSCTEWRADPTPKVNAKQIRDKLEIEKEKEEMRQQLRDLCRSGDAVSLHEILMKSYNEVDAMDKSGLTPLVCAIIARHPTVVTELLLGYANPNISTPRTGMSSLHYAARWGDAQVLHELIRARGWIDAGDRDEWTPLHHCSVNDHFAAADLLTFMLADVHIRDTHNRTALELAQSAKMKRLIERMANVPKDFLKKSCQTHTMKLSDKAGSVDFRCGVVLEMSAEVVKSEIPVSCRRTTPECFRMIYPENDESFLNDVIEFYPRRVTFKRPVTVLVDYDIIIQSKEDIVVTCASKVVPEFSLTSQGKSTTVSFETKKLGRVKILKMKLSDYYESASQSTSVVDFESLRSEQQSRATILSTWDETEADEVETRPKSTAADTESDAIGQKQEKKESDKLRNSHEKYTEQVLVCDESNNESKRVEKTNAESFYDHKGAQEIRSIDTRNNDKDLSESQNPETLERSPQIAEPEDNGRQSPLSQSSFLVVDEKLEDEKLDTTSQKSRQSSLKSVREEISVGRAPEEREHSQKVDSEKIEDKSFSTSPQQSRQSSFQSVREEISVDRTPEERELCQKVDSENDSEIPEEIDDNKSTSSPSVLPSELFSDSEQSVTNTAEIQENINDIHKELAEIEEQLEGDAYIYT